MIIVHHLNNSRSHRILWLLEELGLEYKIEFYQREPTFRAPVQLKEVHPLGKAPVVEVDGQQMAESGAVIEYLVQQYAPGKLAPAADSPLYPKYLELLHYAEGSLSPPLISALYARLLQIDNEAYTALLQEQIGNQLSYVSRLLDGQEYFIGNQFSAADLHITFNLQGAKAAGALAAFANLTEFVARMESRPAYLKAIEKGGPFDLSFGRG